MTEKIPDYYVLPDTHLQQGDIFAIDWVAPISDEVQRIFRCENGKHGSLAFSGESPGKVFSRSELDNVLAGYPPGTPNCNPPFHPTQEGDPELVVVYARLFKYFIVATQTCSLSGNNPLDWVIMLPVITVEDTCKTEVREFKNTHKNCTIQDFCIEHSSNKKTLTDLGGRGYVSGLVSLIDEMVREIQDNDIKNDLRSIKNYLKGLHKPCYVYYLSEHPNFDFPEAIIDFTAAFTVPNSKLEAIANRRVLRLGNDYRNQFSHKFGDFFSRIATEKPMKPTE